MAVDTREKKADGESRIRKITVDSTYSDEQADPRTATVDLSKLHLDEELSAGMADEILPEESSGPEQTKQAVQVKPAGSFFTHCQEDMKTKWPWALLIFVIILIVIAAGAMLLL